MLKRVLSMCLCLMLVLGTLGSITLTASAATVSETVKWSEDFTNATATQQNGTRYVAFNNKTTSLKDANGYEVFTQDGTPTALNVKYYATYLEEVDGNKMLHYNPTDTATASGGFTGYRAYGTKHGGNGSDSSNKSGFNVTTLRNAGFTTSGAWNFSFDLKPVNQNFSLKIVSYGAGTRTLVTYDNGALKVLNDGTSVPLANNEWYKVAFAADGSGNIEVYVNGKKVAEENHNSWKESAFLWFSFGQISGTIGEWCLDNFKVSDNASGFYGTGSAFDATVTTTNAELEIKDTASNNGTTSTVVIPEDAAGTLSAEAFLDTLSYGFANENDIIVELYTADGDAVEEPAETMMSNVDKMVVSTGYATREYEIFVEQNTFVSSSYAVSHSDKTISGVVKNIKVADFLDALSAIEGATLKVMNGGRELTDDDAVTDGATLVSTYSGNTYTYSINFKKYWEEDFSVISNVSGGYNFNGAGVLKDVDGVALFDSWSRLVYRTSTDEATMFYLTKRTGEATYDTVDYTKNGVDSGFYNNGVYGGAFRSFFRNFVLESDPDVYVKGLLKHTLKSNGKGSGSAVTTSGAYNLEFAFKPETDYTNVEFSFKGIKTDNTDFSYFTYDKGAYKAFGQTLDLSSAVADSNGFYNFKIEYLGNGISNVYANDVKVGSNLVGGADVGAVAFEIVSYSTGTDLYVDNIDMYPVVYEAPASTTAVALYKDSVDAANVVTDNADLNAATKYIAKADITCYEASLPVMLMIASYSNGALNKVVCSPRTFAYGDTTDANPLTAEIDKSYVDDADRLCVFLWNGTSLKPYNFIEIK